MFWSLSIHLLYVKYYIMYVALTVFSCSQQRQYNIRSFSHCNCTTTNSSGLDFGDQCSDLEV